MSELGKMVDEAQKTGTTAHNEAISGWKKKIRTGLMVIVGFLLLWWSWGHIVPLLTSGGGGAAQEHGELNFSSLLLLLLLFVAASMLLPSKFSWAGWILVTLTVLVILSGFSPGMNSFWNNVTRGVNHGDWSAPADYVRTVQNGTVTMRRGVVDNFYVVGEVTLVNPYPYTCVGVGPEDTFWIVPERLSSGEKNHRRNVITSKSGAKEMAFVRVKPASECSTNNM